MPDGTMPHLHQTGIIRIKQSETNDQDAVFESIYLFPRNQVRVICEDITRRDGDLQGHTLQGVAVVVPHGVLRQAGVLPPRRFEFRGRGATCEVVPAAVPGAPLTAVSFVLEPPEPLTPSSDSGVDMEESVFRLI